MAWGFYIALYLFLAGAGAGAFLTAVTAEIYSRDGFRPLARSGIIIGAPMVALGMPWLIWDLGIGKQEPWRIFWLFFGNPGSVMTLGAWIISAFVLVGMGCTFVELDVKWPVPMLNKLKARLLPYRRRLLMTATPLAFATAIYTGLLLGVVRAIPLWNNPLLPPLFFISALSTGLAASVVVAVLFPMEERRLLAEHFFYLNQIHSLMIVIETVFIFCFVFLIALSSVTGAQSVSLLTTGSLAPWFWLGVVFFGIVDPMIIYIYEVVLGRPLMPYAMVISDSSVLLGGFVLRYLVLGAAVPVILF